MEGRGTMGATTIVPTARSGETGKIVTAREAVRLIRTGDTVAGGGFGGIGIAEEVVHELGEIYKASDAEAANFGRPSDLTLFFGVGQGQPFTGRGSIDLMNLVSSGASLVGISTSSPRSKGLW